MLLEVTVRWVVDILVKDVVGPETRPRDLFKELAQVTRRAYNACGSSASRSQAMSAGTCRALHLLL